MPYKREDRSRPNIIICVLDAVRARNLSCYGYKRKTTTCIDEFAGNNVIYKNAISTSSWTLPSVTSIFTGLMPSEHKVIDITTKLTTQETIAKKLKEAGYETIAFSNVGWVTKFLGLDRGFNKFYEFDKYSLPKNRIKKFIELLKSGLSIRDYGAEIVNKKIFEWLKQRKKNKPYFLYVHYIEPHFPYNPRRPYHRSFGEIFPWDLLINKKIKEKEYPYFYSGKWRLSKNEWDVLNNLYDGEITYLDKKIGELLNHINKDDNLIFITADHGECLSEKRDLRILQHQFGLYDDLVKVPLIVKYPNNRTDVVENQIQLTDIYYTILNIIKIKNERENRNHIFRENDKEKPNFALSEYIPPLSTLKRIDNPTIDDKYKQIRRSIRTNNFKYIESTSLKEFFDLRKDPLEFNNKYSTLDDDTKKKLHLKLERAFKLQSVIKR